MRVLVVLPTYNEAENIQTTLEKVRENLPSATILVVDDNSPDQTAELAEKLSERLERIEILRRPGKAGLGSAYRTGFDWGLARGYDVFVEMDSDLSHDPADLPALVGKVEEGYDLVIGSRYVRGGSIPDWTLGRRLISRGGNLYAAAMLGFDVKDSTAGYRAYRAEILRRIDLGAVRADGYGFQVEMTYRAVRAGARVSEVPIRFVDRTLGSSKMSAHTVVEALTLVTWWGLLRAAEASRRALRATRRG